MRTLLLTKGYEAIVDDADFAFINQWKWRADIRKTLVYAVRTAALDRRKGQTWYLHRELMNAPAGTQVDHINGDALDNRRCNLRLATCSQNRANNRQRRGQTGYRGVYKDARVTNKPFFVHIGREQCHLGMFATAEEAALAYNEAALAKWGEFATLNVVG